MDSAAPSPAAAGGGADAVDPGVDWESFREHGKQVVDFIADYYKSLQSASRPPVKSQVAPGYLRERLPSSAPESPEPLEALLRDMSAHILPGVTHWQAPSFFGYFSANQTPPSLLGDMLSGAMGVIAFSWVASPAATELESLVLDWLADLLALPPGFRSSGTGGGVIQGTASEATLVALLAARARALARRVVPAASEGAASGAGAALAPSEDEAVFCCRLVAYTSDQAHSSVRKAGMIAGLRSHQLRVLPTCPEDGFALRPEALAAAIAEDKAAGRVPFLAVVTSGTTSSGAFDPLGPLGEVCGREGLWLHVDAAWAGAALVCPELRGFAAGMETPGERAAAAADATAAEPAPPGSPAAVGGVDSWAFNPHKWLRVGFDCCAMYVRTRGWLKAALSITPEYLRSPEHDAGLVEDFRDWGVPLGRRFRALKLWFVLRMSGAAALREHVRRHVGFAADFAGRVAADARFELAAERSLSLVCFRLRLPNCAAPPSPADVAAENALNDALIARLNASGALYIVGTRLAGRAAVRMAIGGALTTAADVEKAWASICEHGAALIAEDAAGAATATS